MAFVKPPFSKKFKKIADTSKLTCLQGLYGYAYNRAKDFWIHTNARDIVGDSYTCQTGAAFEGIITNARDTVWYH